MANIKQIAPIMDTATGSEAALPVGTRLGADFEILSVLGEGGFGIVYLALDHSLQRTVAIKEYMPDSLAKRRCDSHVTVRRQSDSEAFQAGLKSFIQEARLLARFDHPALVKVYRYWEQNDTGYMAMQYYQGRTVKTILGSEPGIVTEDWLKGVMRPVLDALETLYQVQVLHRDISPENIMVQHGGAAVLLDFGAARQVISGLNQAVTVILKTGYAPIEQYANDAEMAQGPWTDIYSLCAVVYHAITKTPPPTSVARMIKDPMVPLCASSHPGYSAAFLAAINSGLAVRPDERPQSLNAFRESLGLSQPTIQVPSVSALNVLPMPQSVPSPAVSASSSASDSPSATPFIKRVSDRKFYLGVCLAVLSALALAGVGYVTTARNSGQTPVDVSASASASDVEAPARTQTTAVAPAIHQVAPQNSSGAKTVTLRVNIKPWGSIIVDGVEMGVSPPLKELKLPEGRHRVTVRNPNFSDKTLEIAVSGNSIAPIEHDFSSNSR